MKKSLLLVCLSLVLLLPAQASAYGTLTLTTVFGGNTQVLTIEELNGTFQGTLVTNGVSQNVFSYFPVSALWAIYIGDDTPVVNYQRTLTTASIAGTLGGRSVEFFGTYKANRSVWLYDGTVGAFDDFTGKGQVDQLNLSWGKTKLKIESTGNGTCSGDARIGGTTTHTFTCDSTGSLADAFFLNPDHVLAWIVNLYVK